MKKSIVVIALLAVIFALFGCQKAEHIEGVDYYDGTFVPKIAAITENIDTFSIEENEENGDTNNNIGFYTNISYNDYTQVINDYKALVEKCGFKYDESYVLTVLDKKAIITDTYVLKGDKKVFVKIKYLTKYAFDVYQQKDMEDGSIFISSIRD